MKNKSVCIITLIIFIGIQLSGCATGKKISINEYSNQQNTQDGYIIVKGQKIYYKVIGEGEPIIVLHGGPGLSHDYLLPGLEKLSENYQVIFYDQRGSGKSTPAILDNQHINIKQFVEDLETLRKSLGIKKFVLIGHSWGGMLAMHYAIKHSQNISALVLIDSMPATSKGMAAFMQEYLTRTKNVSHKLDAIQKTTEFSKREPETISNFIKVVFATYCYNSEDVQKLDLCLDSATAVNFFKVSEIFNPILFRSKFDLRPELNSLKIPTLVIHGDYDPIPNAAALEIAQSIPQAQFSCVKHCGHFPYIEKPKKFFTRVNEFLKIQASAS